MNAPDQGGGNAPAWLFSFVDLAFLLLIAMTQLAADPRDPLPELGELIVPRIEREAGAPLPGDAHELWQLRVHPPGDASPFELVRVGGAAGEGAGERAPLEDLGLRLAEIREGADAKPLLAPHRDSRSQDLLDAVALLEELWPGTRRAAISPRASAP